MSTTDVVPLHQPETIEDSLTAVLRAGARRLLAQAIEAEAGKRCSATLPLPG